MKKMILAVVVFCLALTMLTSCVESRRSGTCPSHDPNYFRR